MYSKLDQYDNYGRKILDSKRLALLEENNIVFRGYIKKEDYNKTIFFDNYSPYDVPAAYHSRKGNDFYYYPHLNTLLNFLAYKRDNKDFGFTASFCIWANTQLKKSREYTTAYDLVKDLLISDINKIKSLPVLGPKAPDTTDRLHQMICSQWAFHMDSCGILLEQGLGKTKVAIDAYMAKRKAGLVDKALVVAPKSILNETGWPAQIKEFGLNVSNIEVLGTRDIKLEIINGMHGNYDMYLINYEGLLNIEFELLSWLDDRTMVVLDEASKIKNYEAKRSRACHAIGRVTKHKLILTGTPITQGAQDIFSQFLFLDCGDTFGASQQKFLDNFNFKFSNGKLRPSKNGLEAIRDLIAKKSIRFTKKECLDLPEKTYQLRQVTMTDQQKEIYNGVLMAEAYRLSQLEKIDAQNILVTILRLQQVSDGMLVIHDDNGVVTDTRMIDGENPKLEAVEDILDEIGDEQIIIWSRFKFMHKQIQKILNKKKITSTVYNGDLSELQKNISEKDFQSGRAQVFISTPAAAGFGKNLQFCSYAIYLDNEYSLEKREQSEDRIHRIGMGDKAIYMDIIAAPIDKIVLQVLKEKKDVANIVTGDYQRIRKWLETGMFVDKEGDIVLAKDAVKDLGEQKELPLEVKQIEDKTVENKPVNSFLTLEHYADEMK